MANDFKLKIGLDTVEGTKSTNELAESIKKIGKAAEAMLHIMSNGKFGKAFDSVTESVQELNTEIKETEQGLKQAGDEGVKSMNKLESSAKKSRMSVMELMTGFNQGIELSKKLISAFSKPILLAADFETMQMDLEVLLGSTEQAKARLQELQEFTKNTSFELPEVVNASKELQSLGKYSQETLAMLSNLAMGSGKSLEQVTSAYSSMARGRKNQAVELFRDIGITTEDFLKATGKGLDSANGMIKASSQEMLQALNQIVKDRNFEGMIEKQSQTLNGMMGNLQDGVTQTMSDIGKELAPLVKDIFASLTIWLDKLRENLKTIIPFAMSATAIFITWKTSIIALTSAFKFLNISMSATPIGAALTGTVALIAVIKALSVVLNKSAKGKLEDSEASLKMLKTDKENAEQQIKLKESTLGLVKVYETLGTKSNKTKSEQDKLKEATTKLRDVYPDTIKNGNKFQDNLDAIKIKAGQTATEIEGYKGKIDELNASIERTKKIADSLAVDVALENLTEKTLKHVGHGAFDKTFGSLVSNVQDWLTGNSLGREGADAFIKDLTKGLREADTETLQNEYEKLLVQVAGTGDARTGQHEKFKELKATQLDELKNYVTELAQGRKRILGMIPNASGAGTGTPTVIPTETKDKKTELDLLAEQLQDKENLYKLETLLLERLLKQEQSTLQERNTAFLDLEQKHLKDINDIEASTQKVREKYSKNPKHEEYKKSTILLNSLIEKEIAIQKSGESRKANIWQDSLNAHNEIQDKIKLSQDLGLTNSEQYLEALTKRYREFADNEFNVLIESYNNGKEITDLELKALQSYAKTKEGLQKEIAVKSAELKKAELAPLALGLEKTKEMYKDSKVTLESYRKFLIDTLNQLVGELNDSKFKDAFKNINFAELTEHEFQKVISNLKKLKPELEGALTEIVSLYDKAKSDMNDIQNELTHEQKYYSDILLSSVEALSSGLGEALASGFGKEGFKKLSQNLFEGFKIVLTTTVDFLQKTLLAADLGTLIMSLIPGTQVKAIANAPQLLAATVGLETLKATINAWVPKFEKGGGVIKPTLLLAGEGNKKEYIISPEQMKDEVRKLLKNEFKYYYYPERSQQIKVDVNVSGEFIQKGRDLYAVVRREKRLADSRRI